MVDTDRVDNKWTDRNIVKYVQSKCKVLKMGWTNLMQMYRLEVSWMRSSFMEKDTMFLVIKKDL